jgi:hypothetical protein
METVADPRGGAEEDPLSKIRLTLQRAQDPGLSSG